MAYVNSQAHCD